MAHAHWHRSLPRLAVRSPPLSLCAHSPVVYVLLIRVLPRSERPAFLASLGRREACVDHELRIDRVRLVHRGFHSHGSLFRKPGISGLLIRAQRFPQRTCERLASSSLSVVSSQPCSCVFVLCFQNARNSNNQFAACALCCLECLIGILESIINYVNQSVAQAALAHSASQRAAARASLEALSRRETLCMQRAATIAFLWKALELSCS